MTEHMFPKHLKTMPKSLLRNPWQFCRDSHLQKLWGAQYKQIGDLWEMIHLWLYPYCYVETSFFRCVIIKLWLIGKPSMEDMTGEKHMHTTKKLMTGLKTATEKPKDIYSNNDACRGLVRKLLCGYAYPFWRKLSSVCCCCFSIDGVVIVG